MTTNVAVFAVAAIFEIAGCFAFWMWLRRDATPLIALLGIAGLICFAVALTHVDSAFAGRAYAAYGNAGCDVDSLRKMLGAYSVIDPTSRDSRDASDPEIFDLLEFSYEKISFPIEGDWHSYMRHNDYSYDQEKGRAEFQVDVNRILERSGIAFELVDGGSNGSDRPDSTRRSAQRPLRQATNRWTRCWRMPAESSSKPRSQGPSRVT